MTIKTSSSRVQSTSAFLCCTFLAAGLTQDTVWTSLPSVPLCPLMLSSGFLPRHICSVWNIAISRFPCDMIFMDGSIKLHMVPVLDTFQEAQTFLLIPKDLRKTYEKASN